MTSYPGPRGERDGSTERNDFDAGQANELARAEQAEAKLAAIRMELESYLEGERQDEDGGGYLVAAAIGACCAVLFAALAAWVLLV